MAVDIYAYADFRLYLREWFAARKEANPRYSHRLFARRLGTGDPSALASVVSGRRSLSPSRVPDFARVLDLDDDETAYFGLLVAFGQASNEHERAHGLARLRAFRAERRPAIDDDEIECVSSYRHAAIRELARCHPLPRDAALVGAQLDPPLPQADAERAIEVLLRLGYLRVDANTWVPAEPTVQTDARVPQLGSWAYHRETDELARVALMHLEERHAETSFTGHTLSLPHSRLRDLQLLLWETFHTVAQQVDTWEGPDRVVQVNVRMFPVSVPPPSSD